MNSLNLDKHEQQGASGILSISIRDLSVLHSAYMPFLENGGLFIPTTKEYSMNDEVFLFLSLMEESEKIPVTGTVVWITPKQAEGGRTTGIGVQFKEKNNEASKKIEQYLAGKVNSNQPTHTL